MTRPGGIPTVSFIRARHTNILTGLVVSCETPSHGREHWCPCFLSIYQKWANFVLLIYKVWWSLEVSCNFISVILRWLVAQHILGFLPVGSTHQLLVSKLKYMYQLPNLKQRSVNKNHKMDNPGLETVILGTKVQGCNVVIELIGHIKCSKWQIYTYNRTQCNQGSYQRPSAG